MPHTPGPWHVVPNGNCYVKRPEWATMRIEQDPDKATAELAVALVITDCETLGEQGESNARLIAASPELLAFAKAFIALFRDSDMRPEDECHELYELATAAVAKAEGGAP
jgi:hypothetical protein